MSEQTTKKEGGLDPIQDETRRLAAAFDAGYRDGLKSTWYEVKNWAATALKPNSKARLAEVFSKLYSEDVFDEKVRDWVATALSSESTPSDLAEVISEFYSVEPLSDVFDELSDVFDESAWSKLREYVYGAGTALNPFLQEHARFFRSDSEAMSSDCTAVMSDLDRVYISRLYHLMTKRDSTEDDQPTGRSEPAADPRK